MLRGVVTETASSTNAARRGAVLRVPVVATRIGDVPSTVVLSDPAQAVAAPAPRSSVSSQSVPEGACDRDDNLAYDQTSNEQVVCEGNTWDKAPITTGVHAAGASCDRPDIPVFAVSAFNDGYLLECDPASRMWVRHG
ncbi:hypothetical protein LAUMK13_02424 [Mycobacterium innocens]|uniref:Uncharacterized protein n=2 Tax=Mycobacterium innocens TaxID=2341083 RepID=A0A498Q3X4_9MYCO|nr:hypothetical protein LAUMK13_02424 [Mycobacterium innocens]